MSKSLTGRITDLALLAVMGMCVSTVSAQNAPSFVVSYIVPNGNQTQISNGGVLNIPDTLVGSGTTVTVVIQNRGTLAGQVLSVSVGGPLFQISGLPLLPASVQPNSELRFQVAFIPSGKGLATSTLQLNLEGGNQTFQLSSHGTGPAYTIENITTTSVVQIPNGGTLTFPTVPAGQSTTLSMRVRNDGDAVGTPSVITTIGSSFVLSNVPPLVPLQPGSSITFNLTFAPSASSIGDLMGRLVVDSQLINLQGTSLGANLSVAFTVSSVTTQIPGGGTVLFPNISVGAKIGATLTLTNTGNIAASVTSVSATGAAFSIVDPALPVSIAAGQSLDFSMAFAPTVVGANTGTLVIDNIVLSLRGIGLAPAALPSYSFTGNAGAAGPMMQPALGLSLASGYPIDITGSLTITFTPTSFVDDPTIQFAQGGRTVQFIIPANTTDAMFGQSKQVQFQTGTVSGTITITPSFAIGEVDLTPASPPVQTVVIAPAAPQLQTLRIGTRTASSFELLITGYSTPRDLSQLVLGFTAAAGRQIQGNLLTVNVSTPFATWYQSASSTLSGSQFTVSLTILVSGDASAVASASVTATNSRGNSDPVSASLQ